MKNQALLVTKADVCLRIAKRLNTEAPHQVLKDLALRAMLLPDKVVKAFDAFLDSTQDEEKEADLVRTTLYSVAFLKAMFTIKAPSPPIRFEDLSPAVVKGLDAFRALLKEGDVRECEYHRHSNDRSFRTCINAHGILTGFLLSNGATFKEAMAGLDFVSDQEWWKKWATT